MVGVGILNLLYLISATRAHIRTSGARRLGSDSLSHVVTRGLGFFIGVEVQSEQLHLAGNPQEILGRQNLGDDPGR